VKKTRAMTPIAISVLWSLFIFVSFPLPNQSFMAREALGRRFELTAQGGPYLALSLRCFAAIPVTSNSLPEELYSALWRQTMSYRFLWKQIASKAISSAMAKAMLSMNTDDLWERMANNESFSEDKLSTLRQEIETRLHEVQEQGDKERELVSQVASELLRGILKRGMGR